MPACLSGKLSVRSSGLPTAGAGVLIMVGAVDGSLLSAVVIGGTADNGLEIAASTIGTMTRSSSAPTAALSAVRARALRRGGRTRARADAASGDGHTVGAGLHGGRSSSARSARGVLTGGTAVASGGSLLALVERAQAANAADARDDDGADDHDVEVGEARDEGHAAFAAAASGDGAQRRAGCAAAERRGSTVAAATAGDAGVRARTRVGGVRSDGRARRPTLVMPVVKHEESGRCREAPTAVSVAGADQAAICMTGMPSVRALSTRLPVIPLPGKAITPLGSRLSRSSLRRKGAALP